LTKELLKYNAVADLKNKTGRTALDYAILENHLEIRRILETEEQLKIK